METSQKWWGILHDIDKYHNMLMNTTYIHWSIWKCIVCYRAKTSFLSHWRIKHHIWGRYLYFMMIQHPSKTINNNIELLPSPNMDPFSFSGTQQYRSTYQISNPNVAKVLVSYQYRGNIHNNKRHIKQSRCLCFFKVTFLLYTLTIVQSL